jgi:hypothetical protein
MALFKTESKQKKIPTANVDSGSDTDSTKKQLLTPGN